MKIFRILLTGLMVLSGPLFLSAQIQDNSIMSDIRYLASDDLKGRETGTPGNKMAREYLLKRFESLGLERRGESYWQTFSFTQSVAADSREVQKLEGKNLIGFISGTTDQYIVITAHYDHIGVIKDKIHNGADDNASGTAGLLALAQYFKENSPKNNLIFVAFDAEEKGLQGAKHFVDNLNVPKESILLNVNMDMISRNDKNEIYACGTSYYPQFKPFLDKAGKQSSINLMFGHDDPKLGYNDWTFSSDHGPFHKAEIPFIYFGVEDHEDYHKHTDEAEKIDPGFVQNTVSLITDFVRIVDEEK